LVQEAVCHSRSHPSASRPAALEMSVIDLNPFNVVLARLEGVADRLEKGLAGAAAPGAGGAGAASASSGGSAPAPAAAEEPAIALSFDAFTSEKLPALQQAVKELGVPDVTEATEMFVSGLGMLRQVLVATGKCRKPKDSDWPKLLGSVMELGAKAQKACDNRSEYFQHRKAAAEALNVVTLVTSSSTTSHVQNVLETMDFHATKVMQKKEPLQTSWSKALKAVVKDLKDWCGEQCKLGLIWSAQGEDPVDYFAAHPLGAAAAAAPAAAPAPAAKGKGRGTPPPPPKGGFTPPPPEVLAKIRGDAGGSAGTQGAVGMTAVFNEIGNFSTGMLKKVTPEMKTKNQPKDVPGTVPAAPKAKAAGAKHAGRGPRGPPIKELQKELNWMIENHDGVPDLVLEEAEKQHLVCVINCRNSTLQIKSKVKSISIDGCERVNVICQDVISAVELVNCERCQVQTLGKVNSFAIDKCNGVNLFLPKESLAAEIVTSKSCEMNVTIPDEAGGEGDTIEIPIPEQFVSRLAGGKKLQTEVSSLYTS